MDKQSTLQSFGLTAAEVSVYLMLLQLGEATASEVAKKTGKNRTFTYDRLKKLGDSGLVSSIKKDNKKYFKAAEPIQLLSILKEREEQIQEILPELEKLHDTEKKEPNVEVYSGIKGVKTACNIMLKEKKTIHLYGTIKHFQESFQSFFEIWNSRRIKEKIPLRVLTSENINLELTEYDILPEEETTITSHFTFGDNILIVMWANPPLAVLIKSKDIAANQINFFNTIWNREVKIYSGVNGILRAFWELIQNTNEFIGFGYSKQLADVYTVEYSNKWHSDRIKRNVKSRLIAYDEPETRTYFGPRTESKKDFNVQYLPKELQGPACISLSDKMIATFVYTEKKFRVIVNKNKETVSVYKKHFEELWKKAKK